ncbi:MAG TPA: ABC transporter substrate-binding protein [Candidatus Limnocylindrales bacterium]|nr:ABC transporter substrate-binding protein [Candidatus Limnocylindrales bacterium]
MKTELRAVHVVVRVGLVAAMLFPLVVTSVLAQTGASAQEPNLCACGSHPPKPRPQRTMAPYANEPKDLQPYSKFAEPYDHHYIQTNVYSGAARDVPDPDMKDLTEIRIGFLGPIDTNPDQVFGQRMLNGAQLAVDQANARGGYCGKPFKLMPRNDYDNWQAKAVYGDNRPTSQDIWGSASNQTVKMVYDDKDWAIFGSISSESTHILLRVALRAEIPIVNSASTDPTIPETYIPWYFTDLQDDRVQANTLARYIYDELKLKRVALLRINNRYGRFGSPKFKDASQRLGHPVVIEQRYPAGTTDFTRELRAIQASRADGIVLWNDQEQTAMILKQMHELSMKQLVFGSYRTIGDDLIAQAGDQAEGFEAVFPYDASRTDPRWQKFNSDYAATYREKPEQFASLAYDAMNVLLGSVCEAGLNKGRIMDSLAQVYEYDGVTGHMVFDTNSKNIAPMYLARIHNGRIEYRPASMEPIARQAEPKPAPPSAAPASESTPPKIAPVPYARVGEDGVSFSGPSEADSTTGVVRIAVFGPHADQLVRSPEVLETLTRLNAGHQQWSLIAIPSDVQWGKATSELVRAVFDQDVLGIVALDRDSSHLAEQFGVKTFVPVIAISSDHALTSTNIPWIFRMSEGTSLDQALQALVAAEKQAGPSRARLREVLASGTQVAGVRFQSTGEPR